MFTTLSQWIRHYWGARTNPDHKGGQHRHRHFSISDALHNPDILNARHRYLVPLILEQPGYTAYEQGRLLLTYVAPLTAAACGLLASYTQLSHITLILFPLLIGSLGLYRLADGSHQWHSSHQHTIVPFTALVLYQFLINGPHDLMLRTIIRSAIHSNHRMNNDAYLTILPALGSHLLPTMSCSMNTTSRSWSTPGWRASENWASSLIPPVRMGFRQGNPVRAPSLTTYSCNLHHSPHR